MTDLLERPRSTESVSARRQLISSVVGRALFGARFMTIWIATLLLLLVARIVAPATLSETSWSTMLPIAGVLAMVAIGQMLVIMMGGIDLSMGATISLLANILVGVAQGREDRLALAIVVMFLWAIVIGLANGFLIGVLDLNPLIVTLATGLIIGGATAQYRLGTANSTSVPDALSRVVFERVFGISKAFWFVLLVTLIVGFLLRSTTAGRRFQAVGANRRASWMAGIRVRAYVVSSYVFASIAGGVAAIVLSAIVDNPGLDPGASYLLAPIAAVVLGGASLTGGLASTASTWLAAFFVVVLNQMLRVLGLSTAVQPIVFGVAIVLGMLISGDRIAELVGRLLVLRPSLRSITADPTLAAAVAPESDAIANGLAPVVEPDELPLPSVARDGEVVLRLRGISKRYGPVQANDDVSLEVRAGEIHALLGENGSGKSTLLGISSGTVAPDSGTVEIAGAELAGASSAAAKQLGLGMAYQTMSEVVGLSVAENLYLAAPPSRRPDYGAMIPWAQEYLDSYALDIRAVAPAGNLSAAKRQLLEVVQALLSDPRVLLLDEPTTALGHADVRRLHGLIQRLASEGLGVVYVSHRLPEVLEVADRITVLRDGVSQGTFDADAITEQHVVALMIGRPLELVFPDRPGLGADAGSQLSIAGLGGHRFGPVDLDVRPGEIVGIAGTEGNGQTDLLRALVGVEPSNGTVTCAGRRVTVHNPRHALRSGIVLLSSDRKSESVLVALAVRANATLQVLGRFGRLGYVSRKRERGPVNDLVERLRLKASSIEQPVGYLSGGNQQKVALMRTFLKGNLKVVLADEPTQGVDVGARLDIYTALREKSSEGAAILVKSSDAIELAGLCDRVVVMSRGRIVDELGGDALSEARIIASIIGRASTHADPWDVDALTPHSGPEAGDDATGNLAPIARGSVLTDLGAAERQSRHLGRWLPIVGLLGLITALALYTNARNPAFHSSFNLNGLLIATLPMACVAMGQTSALMVKAFDVSAGALMGFCVVIASFVLRPDDGWPMLLLGMVLVIAIAVAVAAVNVFLIRTLGLSSIIATLATMSVLEGASLWLRPQPAGIVSSKFVDAMFAKIGFVPYAFIGVVVVAGLADIWLYRTSGGLAARAAGLDEVSAVRRGVRVQFLFTRAFFVVALGAGIGAFFLAAQVGVGDPNVGNSFTLTSIAAAVLGGASLLGGRGSFVGAVVGAVFLNIVINVLPFLGWSSAYGRIMIGIFTLLALSFYQAPELLARARQEVANVRVSRRTSEAAVAQ